MSDACRWERAGSASDIVQPAYLTRFLDRRRAWGEDIRVADTEVLEVRVLSGDSGAAALVEYGWYRPDTMTLRRTTVQQRWRPQGNAYVLEGEEVVRGDPGLFAGHRPAPAQPPGPLGLQ